MAAPAPPAAAPAPPLKLVVRRLPPMLEESVFREKHLAEFESSIDYVCMEQGDLRLVLPSRLSRLSHSLALALVVCYLMIELTACCLLWSIVYQSRSVRVRVRLPSL